MFGIRAVALLGIAPLALAACGGSSAATAPPASSPSAEVSPSPESGAGVAVVKSGMATVAGASLTVLTDAQGQTLYYRTGDSSTTITCTGTCAANWPPILLPAGTPTAASGVTGTLSVLAGPNGRQVLYNGHPLYLWVKDTAPGQATGQNIGGFKVVTPDIAPAA